MIQRVFIKVVGFNDVERHALNTVFRLSEQRDTIYTLWAPGAPEAPQMALLDGLSYEARLEAESPKNAELKLVWVGDAPPENAWRTFLRPLAWPQVVNAMDELFAVKPALDFDLDFNEASAIAVAAHQANGRALIASEDLAERLYLRAKLSLSNLTLADEAGTLARVLELVKDNKYQVALLDYGLLGLDRWTVLKQLSAAPIPHIVLFTEKVSLAERAQARHAGAEAVMRRPPDPTKLQELLERCRPDVKQPAAGG
jgi:CheY-like chemotaxis protein